MSVVVRLKPGESTDNLIKRFKKKVVYEKVIEQVKDRVSYMKPSQVKQEAIKEKKRKIKRYQRQKYD